MKQNNDINEANVLVEWAANLCKTERVAKVFGKEDSEDLKSILFDFVEEWESVEVDPDGATPEQDAALDAVLDKYQDMIHSL